MKFVIHAHIKGRKREICVVNTTSRNAERFLDVAAKALFGAGKFLWTSEYPNRLFLSRKGRLFSYHKDQYVELSKDPRKES
jgi:hypothetical protein